MPKKKNKGTKNKAVDSKAAAPLPPVDDRRLNSIYSAIDSRNIKSALKQIEGAVEKHGPEDILVALRALVWSRSTGKREESLRGCRDLLKKEDLDQRTYTPLLIVTQELNAAPEQVIVREKMCAQQPADKKLALELHTLYSRTRQYDRQQKLSMKLYSICKDPKYLFWSGAAQLLVARNLPSGPDTMLRLCESMILARLPKDTAWPSEQLLLIIQVLMKQEKYDMALELMTGVRSHELKRDIQEYLWWIVQLYEKLGKWSEALDTRIQQLKISNDDWLALQGYIDAAIHLERKTSELSAFLTGLQQQESKSKNPSRSPFLAECELAVRRPAKDSPLAGLSNALCGYFRHFGHKTCFFNDVEQYLKCFISEPKEGGALMASLLGITEELYEAEAEQIRENHRFCRVASQSQCSHYLGLNSQLSDSKLEVQCQQLWTMYVESTLYEKSILSSERGIGDPLAQICVWMLFDLFLRTKKRSYLVKAISRLLFALEATSTNFQLRLMLIRLYCYYQIGAVGLAVSHFKKLDIKQVLNDSCSHLILPDLVRVMAEEADTIIHDLLEYHINHTKQAPDLLKLSYSSENFVKVLEFVELQDRLEGSLQKSVAEAEKMHLSLVRLVSSADTLQSLEPANVLTYLQVAGDVPQNSEQLGNYIANQDYRLVACFNSKDEFRFAINNSSPSVFLNSFRLSDEKLPYTKTGNPERSDGPASVRNSLALQHAIVGYLVSEEVASSTALHEKIHYLVRDLFGSPQDQVSETFTIRHWALVEEACVLDLALHNSGQQGVFNVTLLQSFQTSLFGFIDSIPSDSSPPTEAKTIFAPAVQRLMFFLTHMGTFILIFFSKWKLAFPSIHELKKGRESEASGESHSLELGQGFEELVEKYKAHLTTLAARFHDQLKHQEGLEKEEPPQKATTSQSEDEQIALAETQIMKDVCGSLSRALSILEKHSSLL
eukprot:gb/GEZN01001593.1/.p1 GENE.gb/GEZN01001593.1/~~gb/GEZN01001593.1/.p1  ORF type:complete len:949 (-),score=137.53 gb/GEZN01001593.1/:65-2911(-)